MTTAKKYEEHGLQYEQYQRMQQDERQRSYIVSPAQLLLETKIANDDHPALVQLLQQRKRNRSPTPPFDDYPVPDVDDMRIPPHRLTYTRKRTRRDTSQTPSEYERIRADFIRRRDDRREQEDREFMEGLKKFKGNQRGWDGNPESERREAEEKRRSEDVLPPSPPCATLRPYPRRVTAKQLEDAFEAHQSIELMKKFAVDDLVTIQKERNYNEMIKSKWDPDTIRSAVLEDMQENEERIVRGHLRVKRNILSPTHTNLINNEQIQSTTPPTPIATKTQPKIDLISPGKKRSRSMRSQDGDTTEDHGDIRVNAGDINRKRYKLSVESSVVNDPNNLVED